MKTQAIITLSICFGLAIAGIIIERYKSNPGAFKKTAANVALTLPAIGAIIHSLIA